MQRILDRLVEAGATGVLMHYRDQDREWRGSAGVADLDSRQPVDPDGWFRIGSVTKTFTATVVLSLVAEGLVDLDQPIEHWLPGVVPSGDAISVRRLLNHTSGLYNYTEDLPDSAQIVRDRFDHWEPQRALSLAFAHEPLFAPGADWSYSNTNYTLLGLLIETVTGGPYAAAVRARVLEPLELGRTLVPGDDAKLPEPHAHGYLLVDGESVDLDELNPSQAWAAGELISTAADLNTFFAALLGGDLLPPDQLNAMLTTVGDYGLGIARRRLTDGTEFWGHNGGIFGYLTSSFHSRGADRQCTMSRTTVDAGAAEADDLVAEIFLSGLD
ncbi:serine hydrolase domain-containing protein [Kribbella sp. NPDC051620]|uniref:serine hydrolase domain-containing protein n=1 Tax=Kribbella sp. NPDC051620 TaxID=3364120 RepID=UPI0037ABF099